MLLPCMRPSWPRCRFGGARDAEGYRICEANSAPGFTGLEQACGIDVPASIFEWVRESMPAPAAAPMPAPALTAVPIVAASRAHLAEVGESYREHFRFAAAFGRQMCLGGLACLLHALVPALFADRGSRTVTMLGEVVADRGGPAAARLRGESMEPSDAGRAPLLPLAMMAMWAAAIPWLLGAAWPIALLFSLLSAAFIPAFLWVERREAGGRGGTSALPG
jgi:gamma-F420-2:alpha-L-glutamate ligase